MEWLRLDFFKVWANQIHGFLHESFYKLMGILAMFLSILCKPLVSRIHVCSARNILFPLKNMRSFPLCLRSRKNQKVIRNIV
jgi:hypothetical protein